ncbi:MAG: helix-turn-helix domain-containing protein [Dongiaceae bacterium]
MSQQTVTILRHADGTAQHAILTWADYQALLHAAEDRGATPPSPSIPDAVRDAIAGGAHPLRAWREHCGFNQAQLAALVGISRAYLTQIEGGERTGTIEVMARIARALGRSIEDLVARRPDDFGIIAAALGAMPARLKEHVALIGGGLCQARPAAGGFSLVEHVCHLRDLDADGYGVRLDRMLKEECPTLPDIDGDALARDREYQSQDVEAALAAFTAIRWEIATRLAKLTAEDRRRTGLMAGTRQITIEELADTMMAHDAAHLDEIEDLRAELAR